MGSSLERLMPEILTRRSVREYEARPVEKDKILTCMEAARLAPSACNKQPWHFIVVDDPAKKEELCRAAFNFPPRFNHFAFSAPVLIAVVAEVDFLTHHIFGGMQGLPYYLLDIGAAIENLMLQAVKEGLGSCWLGWFDERGVKKALTLPAGKRIVSLLTLGYPANSDLPLKTRKETGEIVSFNTYRKK